MHFSRLRLKKVARAGQPCRSLWVLGFRCQVSGNRGAKSLYETVKSEPQNRRISNVECRSVESLRSVFIKMDRIHLFDVRCSSVSYLIRLGARGQRRRLCETMPKWRSFLQHVVKKTDTGLKAISYELPANLNHPGGISNVQ